MPSLSGGKSPTRRLFLEPLEDRRLLALTTVIDHGPSSNRVDLVFVGDGYTASQLGTYADHVNATLDHLFVENEQPFVRYSRFFNAHRIDIVSNESGADRPSRNIYRDTALDAHYDCDGLERLLCINTFKAEAIVATETQAAGVGVDVRLAAVNDSIFGGAGGFYSVFAARNSNASEIALHEMGHTFNDLDDEYGGGGHYTGSEPEAVNLTKDSAGSKWSEWLGHDQPGIGVIGAYAGGGYHDSGIYRPSQNSKMRTLGRPFDAISREKIIRDIYELVDPLDSWTDNRDPIVGSDPALSAIPIDSAVIELQWYVDGNLVAGATGSAFHLSDFGYSPGQYTVEVKAHDATQWVRGDRGALEQSVRWTVTLTASPKLTVDFDQSNISEWGGQATATISRWHADTGQALEVQLSADDSSELSVPASVIIPAGQLSVQAVVSAVDDTLSDGGQVVLVTPSANGFQSQAGSITVNDHETLTVTLDRSLVSESDGTGAATATVTRSNTDVGQALTFGFQFDDSEVHLVTPAVLPSGQQSATFSLDAVEDLWPDGNQTITLAAQASGYSSVVAAIQVVDTTAQDWGTLDYRGVHDLPLDRSLTWFTFTAKRSGRLTLDARFSHAQGDVDLDLLDSQLQTLAFSRSQDNDERVDYDVQAGHRYYAKLSGMNPALQLKALNMLVTTGSEWDVFGTDDDDIFWMSVDVQRMTVQGVEYAPASGITRIRWHGGDGNDTLELDGSASNEQLTLRVGSLAYASGGREQVADAMETLLIRSGGGTDRAHLFGGPTDDIFIATPSLVTFSGTGFSHQLVGYREVRADARQGGNDVARLYDSSGPDAFYGQATLAWMQGDAFLHVAQGFDRVDAYSQTGSDTAYLYDTSGDDEFYGRPELSWMSGTGYMNVARQFDRVQGYANGGGFDRAWLYDGPGDDQFQGRPDHSYMTGAGYANVVYSFDKVDAYSTAGGIDDARLYDSSGDDLFYGYPTHSWLTGTGYYNVVNSFERVLAYASAGGQDHARMYDAPGNQTFYGRPSYSYLMGDGFAYVGYQFDRVYAYAHEGGYDRAWLYDSAGNDQFYGQPTASWLMGDGYSNIAYRFDRVYATSSAGGLDVARLYDSAGADTFHVRGGDSWLTDGGYLNLTRGFARVRVYATSGNDEAHFEDLVTGDQYVGAGSEGHQTGASGNHWITGFDRVTATVRDGHRGKLRLQALDYVFESFGDWDPL